MPQKSGIPAYIRRAQITKGGSTVSKKQEVMRGAAAPMRMILLYSRDYFKEHGYAPTLRVITPDWRVRRASSIIWTSCTTLA